MSRRVLVAGNWKMNHTPAVARDWCRGLREQLAKESVPETLDLAVAPPFVAIGAVAEAVGEELPLILLAQTMHEKSSGAFTGEVSGPMLIEAGCRGVILGHSERRHVFGESDELVGRKLASAREQKLLPLLCIGETEEEREAGRTETVLERQLRRGLGATPVEGGAELVVAYEPVWAIGTGRVANSEQVQEAHAFVRRTLAAVTSQQVADQIRVLYGGSVKPKNAEGLAALADVDGFLIGGASLDAETFATIARQTARAKGL
jgi:triosephosphate isomerase